MTAQQSAMEFLSKVEVFASTVLAFSKRRLAGARTREMENPKLLIPRSIISYQTAEAKVV